MANIEPIRLNLKVHPDKDPALYQLLINIVKEARSRRVMNLANTGLLMEMNGMVADPQLKQVAPTPNLISSEQMPILEDNIITPSNDDPRTPLVDEEELETIGGMFK
jgi:hypothetical protein